MGYNVMDAAQAINFPGFIRPDLLEDENFSDYVFYTADDERGLLGMAVVNPQINGPELLSIAVICSAGSRISRILMPFLLLSLRKWKRKRI